MQNEKRPLFANFFGQYCRLSGPKDPSRPEDRSQAHRLGFGCSTSLPTAFIVWYWRRVFAGPRGNLWFAAHGRAAPEEMRALADELQRALRRFGQPTRDLDKLLSPLTPS